MSSDSFESRIREMAAERLQDAHQFTNGGGEGRTSPVMGGSTSLLLGMCDTLRACMRDWPNNQEFAAESHAARLRSMERLKTTLKEARRLTRSTTDDSLVFVLAEALFVMAEQWSTPREAAKNAPRTFPNTFRSSSEQKTSTVPRTKTSSAIRSPAISNTTTSDSSFVGEAAPLRDEEMEECGQGPSATAQIEYAGEDSLNNDNNLSGNEALDALFANVASKAMEGVVKSERWNEEDDQPIWLVTSNDSEAPSPSGISPSMRQSFNGETKKFRYHCDICGQGCIARTQLEAHKNVHTGERPFQCLHCPKAYKRKDHLTDHVKKTHPEHYQSIRKMREEKAKLVMMRQ